MTASRAGVEIILEDDRCCRSIEALLPRAPVLFPQRESRLRLSAREAFVLEEHRHRYPGAQPGGKRLDASRHVVGRPVEAPGQADDHQREPVVFAGQPRNRLRRHVGGVAVEAGRPKHRQRPRERTGGIADRHADPPLPDIEAEHSRHAV